MSWFGIKIRGLLLHHENSLNTFDDEVSCRNQEVPQGMRMDRMSRMAEKRESETGRGSHSHLSSGIQRALSQGNDVLKLSKLID